VLREVERPALNTSGIVSTQLALLTTAVANGDVTTVITTAATAAAASNGDSNSTNVRATQSSVVMALRQAVANSSAPLSTNQRSAAVQVLLSAARNVSFTNATLPGVLATLRAVVQPGMGSAGASDTASDAMTDGANVLRLASQSIANASDIAENVARVLGQGLTSFDTRSTLSAPNVTVAVIARPAGGSGGMNLAGNTTAVMLPATFGSSVFANATPTSVATVGVTEFVENPYGTNGVPKNRTISAAVVTINVQQDGSDFPVANLTDLIRFNVTIDKEASMVPNATHRCVFFNERSQAWDSPGVTTLGYEDATRTLMCATAHLTTFSATSAFPIACAARNAEMCLSNLWSLKRQSMSELTRLSKMSMV